MIKTIALRGILGLGLAALLSQAVIAQVMAEVCPALIGKNAKFDANITTLTQSYLADYSDKSMTLAKLQADSEYKSVLEEARQAAKETDKSEQKSVCDDVLNYEA